MGRNEGVLPTKSDDIPPRQQLRRGLGDLANLGRLRHWSVKKIKTKMSRYVPMMW